MINETKQRIEAYKAALPGIKERIIAAALLLAISIAMVTSASFAWISISTSPEVTGMSTTLAANGNLEIALVNPDGSLPNESKVGDSFAADGQTITGANLTWGNMVNLSDASYGLSNIVLRPALLSNASNLLNQPLKGADYGEDGRVDLYYNENFLFTNWVGEKDGVPGHFEYPDIPIYGVRAISTVEYVYLDNTSYKYNELMRGATGLYSTVGSTYDTMLSNDDYINALAGLIGDYMTDRLNDKNGSTDVSGYIPDVYMLLSEFEGILNNYADVLVALANVQVYNKYGPDTYSTYTITKEMLFGSDQVTALTAAQLKDKGIVLDSLDDYNRVKESFNQVMYGYPSTDADGNEIQVLGVADYYARVQNDKSATVTFKEVDTIINMLVHINSCKIIDPDGVTYTVGGIGASAGMKLLRKEIDAIITKGLLKDFEQLTGYKMFATDVKVSAHYMMTVEMTAKSITTAAKDPFIWTKDKDATDAVAAQNKGEFTATAQDTYGMAIDFWVRTNSANSHLILEGNVLTEESEVRATGIDQNGKTVYLWTVTVTTTIVTDDNDTPDDTSDDVTEEVEEDVAIYIVNEDGTNLGEEDTVESGKTYTYRNAKNHSIIAASDTMEVSTPVIRMDTVTTVIGYEGENRVWQDSAFMSTDSTTQGSGSCYVFYADDPAQQENSLRLLSNLRVAFIDADPNSDTYGKMVGLAKLDIENRFEENGKVTLPLVLTDDGSSYLTTYSGGLAIKALDKNVATRITAVVYLDGREMSNSDVLAANDIQGQLNIQFGTSTTLEPLENETLQNATRSVSVTSSATNSGFGGNSTIEFTYGQADPMTVYVRAAIDGEDPSKVTAFFMRKVNATQGSREDTFELTQGDDGYWYGSYTFTSPGEYVLRTVQLDGVDYDLPNTEGSYPHVKIAGFSIDNVTLSYNNQYIDDAATVMTGDRSVTTNLTMKLASDQKLPSNVKLQFLKDDGTQVTANMSLDTTSQTWSGNATFTTSGTYTLLYAIMDGEYTELDPAYQRTLVVYAGITVSVEDGGDKYQAVQEWKGEPATIPMYVEIYDDTGEEIRYLTGTRLVYTTSGSVVNGSDPDLEWDPDEDCYVSNLLIKGPGVYTFNSVTLGSSILKNTTGSAPIYTYMSPNPTTYEDNGPMADMEYELSTESNDVQIGVRLNYAEAATVTAILKNMAEKNEDGEYGKIYEVLALGPDGKLGTDDDGNGTDGTFYFSLPTTDAEGKYQSGDWQLVGLRLVNATDENKQYHGADNPMEMDLTTTGDDLDVKVVNVNYTLAVKDGSGTIYTGDSMDELLDKDANGNAIAFMGSATVSKNIVLTLTDQNGEPLNMEYISVTGMNLAYDYVVNSAQEYGGYTSTADQTQPKIEKVLVSSDGGITYVAPAITLSYAGKYTGTSLSFTVADDDSSKTFNLVSEERYSDKEQAIKTDMPVYMLQTARPTVTVTGVGTSGETLESTIRTAYRIYSVSKPTSRDQLIGGDNGTAFSSFTDYGAVVYIQVPTKTGDYDQEAAEACAPTVTLSLTGVPTGATATMTFETSNADSLDSVFNFSNGSAKANVGKAVNGERQGDIALALGADPVADYPECYPAGTMKQNKITITYNSVSYEVTLVNAITIDQPQSPAALNFAGIPESYTETKPAQVIGSGTMVTVTLPELYWTARIEEPKDGTWSAYTSVGEVAEVNGQSTKAYTYTTWVETGACDSKTTYYTYQYFTWTKFQSSITAETDIYTQNKKIVQWVINGKTYNAGDTITVTGNGIITATAVVANNGAKTFVETKTQTTYKYLYGYVAESKVTKTETDPDFSYNLIGTVGATESAALATTKIANVSNANAATDTYDTTTTTTDSAAYASFWP